MAEKHRLDGQAFTCSNYGFHTDISKGASHGGNDAKGSVFGDPLVTNKEDGKTLWLEHVKPKRGEKAHFWLMWYDKDGNPTIPASGVMDAKDVREMASRLAHFIELP